MAKLSLFITNDLQGDDELIFSSIPNLSYEGKSLVKIEPIPFESLPDSDWIFFYSKTAVNIFKLLLNDITNIKSKKFGVIGHQTAISLEKELGITPDFIYIGQDISILKGQSVLFPRAKNSRKTIDVLLDPQLVTSVIIYDNQPDISYPLPSSVDILAVTSPMNGDAIFTKSPVIKYNHLITLGSTTADHLFEKYGIISIQSQEPSLESIRDKILSII
jgi:uroporphyrinogen-III synthase